jgi:hypothetical protein
VHDTSSAPRQRRGANGAAQASQVQEVGPAAAEVLARLVTLLRSPAVPVQAEDVRELRVEAMPALAKVCI